MLYIPSFRFSFSDSIMENKNRVIKFPFPCSYFKNRKGNIEIWSALPIFIHFSFATSNKKKQKKQPLLYMPSFAFPFGVIQLGKQIKNQTILCSFSDYQLLESINGIFARLTCFGICVLYLKHWQSEKTFVWSMFPLLRSETVIRKRESPPVHASFTA